MNVEEKVKYIRQIGDLLKELAHEPNMIKLSKENYNEYLRQMSEVAPNFSNKYPSLFGLICDRKDTTLAEIILNNHIDYSRGTSTKEQLEERIGKAVGDAMYTFEPQE